MTQQDGEVRSAPLAAPLASSRQPADRAAVRDLRLTLFAAVCCTAVLASVLVAAAMRLGSWVPVLVAASAFLIGVGLALAAGRAARQHGAR